MSRNCLVSVVCVVSVVVVVKQCFCSRKLSPKEHQAVVCDVYFARLAEALVFSPQCGDAETFFSFRVLSQSSSFLFPLPSCDSKYHSEAGSTVPIAVSVPIAVTVPSLVCVEHCALSSEH